MSVLNIFIALYNIKLCTFFNDTLAVTISTTILQVQYLLCSVSVCYCLVSISSLKRLNTNVRLTNLMDHVQLKLKLSLIERF